MTKIGCVLYNPSLPPATPDGHPGPSSFTEDLSWKCCLLSAPYYCYCYYHQYHYYYSINYYYYFYYYYSWCSYFKEQKILQSTNHSLYGEKACELQIVDCTTWHPVSWADDRANVTHVCNRRVTRESLLLTIDHLLWGGIYTYPQPLSPNKVKEPTGVRAKAPLHVLLYFTGH